MKRAIITYLVCALAALVTFEARAQKYPERRTVREGTKLYNSGDYEGAAEAYGRAMKLSPELLEARFNLGNALFRQQKPEDAASAWGAIAADSLATPGLVSAANFNLGNIALAGQQTDEAIEAYKAALRVDPGDMQAKWNLAYARKMKREQEENKDQNKDQNDDKNSGDDQKQDNQNKDDQNNKDDKNGQDNQKEDDKKDDQSPQDDNKNQSQQAQGAISREDASQMLDAMQDEEDKTREKVNAQKVPAVGRSGKNW